MFKNFKIDMTLVLPVMLLVLLALILVQFKNCTERKIVAHDTSTHNISLPVIVKKKYAEQSVTKDIVFGTGNWYDMKYYIVDQDDKIWDNVDKETFIICEVGDTLWVNPNYNTLVRNR